ncbi:MAG: tetratricopeptide repeat protein [Acidobacteriota bacterium]
MKSSWAGVLLLMVLAPAATLAGGADVARLNTEGNRLYARGEHEKALAKYVEALEEAKQAVPEQVPTLHYNMGNALYRLGRFEEAAREYAQAGAGKTGSLGNSAQYNEGNTRFAAEDYDGAADLYRKVLRSAPGRKDARHNLELALARQRMKERQENGKESPEGSRKDKKKQRQGQDQESGTQRQAGSENQGGQKGNTDARRQPGKERQGSPARQAPEGFGLGGEMAAAGDEGDNETDHEASRTRQAEIGREEAARLLKAMEQDERADLKEALRRPRRKRGRMRGHDW